MWRPALLAALLTVSAQAARAANPDLQRGLKLYDSLDYMPALDALQAAEARTTSTRKEKVEIQIYIGMISIALGDEAKARSAFAKAIALDRKARAPAGASPKVASILDQLRAEGTSEVAPPEPQPGGQPEPTPQPTQPAPPQQPAANPYPATNYPPNSYPQSSYPPNAYPYGSPYYAQPPAQQASPPQQQVAPEQSPPPSQQPVAPYASTPAQPDATATLAPASSSNAWSAVTGFTALILGVAGVGAGVYFQLQNSADISNGNGESTAAAALNDQKLRESGLDLHLGRLYRRWRSRRRRCDPDHRSLRGRAVTLLRASRRRGLRDAAGPGPVVLSPEPVGLAQGRQ